MVAVVAAVAAGGAAVVYVAAVVAACCVCLLGLTLEMIHARYNTATVCVVSVVVLRLTSSRNGCYHLKTVVLSS